MIRGAYVDPVKKSRFLLALIGMSLVAFAAVDVRYIGSVFNHSVRWGFLVVILIVLLHRGVLGLKIHGFAKLIAIIYLLWVFLSTLWSLVPLLSLAKAIANASVMLAFTSAGYVWVRAVGPKHAMLLFAPMTALAMLVSVLGATTPEATINAGAVLLYSGLAYNPNLLGILIIMSLPWAIMKFDKQRHLPVESRLFSLALAAALLAIVVLTGARSSILAVGIATLIYVLYAGFGRYVIIVFFAATLGLAITTAFPFVLEKLWGVVAKGTQESGDILVSRRGVWADSLDGATEGGWLGVGYGVSAGETSFELGVVAAQYGREKGNSALAVVEELGLVGFTFYFLLSIGLLVGFFSAASRTGSRQVRIGLAIVSGAMIGLIANSQFEAWWTAPGAPASPFFWALVGVGTGLRALDVQTTLRAHIPRRIGRSPVPGRGAGRG
jgi:hypothetical protein